MKYSLPLLERARRAADARVKRVCVPWRDAFCNWRHATAEPRFLVVRDSVRFTDYYNGLLNWLQQDHSDLRALFELRTLPCQIRDWSQYRLLISWIPETFLKTYPRQHARIEQLESQCRQNDVAIINPSYQTLRLSKSAGARLIASAGIRTPRIEPIRDIDEFRRTLCGMSFPLLIREDWGHAGNTRSYLVRKQRELDDVPLEQFANPIASEFINVQSPRDGFYRRYRYFAAGDSGFSTSLHVAGGWEVRGKHRVHTDVLIDEEKQFVSTPDPNHELLQRARRILGLDFLAFDYSYDRAGRLVVWEVNSMPGVTYPHGAGRDYMIPVIQRSWMATIKLYLQRAGMSVPSKVESCLELPAKAHFLRRAA